jgi:hypothetical protein
VVPVLQLKLVLKLIYYQHKQPMVARFFLLTVQVSLVGLPLGVQELLPVLTYLGAQPA